MTHDKNCKTCGNDFLCNRLHKQFCSRLCYRRDPVNKAKYIDRTKTYQKQHATEISRRFNKIMYKSTSENRDFNLDLEFYRNTLIKGCFYCSGDLMNSTGSSLDRLNNLMGYTKDNVIPCCGSCNQIRNNHLSHEEMIVAMKEVLKLRKKS